LNALRRATRISARGEPGVWLLAAGLVTAALMIAGLLGLILYQGFRTFWPREILLIRQKDGPPLLGDVSREDLYKKSEGAVADGAADSGYARRLLIRVGNYDLYGEDFRWVAEDRITGIESPPHAVLVERDAWGPFLGFLGAVQVEGKTVSGGPEEAWEMLRTKHPEARALREKIRELEEGEIADLHGALEDNRLALRRVEMKHGAGSAEYASARSRIEEENARIEAKFAALAEEAAKLKAEDSRHTVLLTDVGGLEKTIPASEIVRIHRPNSLGFVEKLKVYASRWWEFLADQPREANTEGGIFPALFGTVLMTMILALAVAPFGVLAALYLREYAKQGILVSAVRIAVNNLAGVPSIVFGVFGLGFFCYIVGGSIDRFFFPEKLPSPTFGTGGLLWASLTLALMTAPVVIVATEEALAAVPRSMREGAYACGASKWQTLRRIVIPKALPGILTGMILAMARGAGEVAPLMITGVVKLAHELPIDGEFPYFHLNRSFMHLGFHIYDVGFQSRNAEAGKPMVFTTTLLLITVVLAMNLAVIAVRARLKRKYAVGHF